MLPAGGAGCPVGAGVVHGSVTRVARGSGRRLGRFSFPLVDGGFRTYDAGHRLITYCGALCLLA